MRYGNTEHWVLVLGWLTMGGAERQALYLAQALMRERGARVSVVGLSNPGYVIDECRRLGIECHYWPFEFPDRYYQQWRSIFRFAARLRRLGPTFVAPYCMPANLICGLTWRLTGAKACVWQQRDEGRLRRRDWIEPWAVRLTPAFISNSVHAARWLETDLQVAPTRISVIRNGIILPEVSPHTGRWRDNWHISADKKILTMVANLHQYKDHLTLLQAWKIIRQSEKSSNWMLVLAGRYEDTYSELQTFVVDNNLLDSVLFTNRISDVPVLLDDAALLVFSSLCEGVPNGILEGMAHGLAVVATDIAGIREAVGSASEDQFAIPSDPQDLAMKIMRLMADPTVRGALGRRNRERVEALHGMDAMVHETIAVFQSLLSVDRVS